MVAQMAKCYHAFRRGRIGIRAMTDSQRSMSVTDHTAETAARALIEAMVARMCPDDGDGYDPQARDSLAGPR